MEVTKKVGRPKGINKNIQTRIRMTEEEAEKLEYCAREKNMTKTDIVVLGIEKVYQEIKNNKK